MSIDNNKRAGNARAAAQSYSPGNDDETAITDLLGDLMHAADDLGCEFDELVRKARWHYDQELEEADDELKASLTVEDIYAACKSDGDYAMVDDVLRRAVELKKSEGVSASGGE